MRLVMATMLLMLVIVCATARRNAALPTVALERTPSAGLQPQIAVDAAGAVHAVYFTGDPARGTLEYVVSRDGGAHFSAPLAVNQHADAMAVGNMRGAHLALGPRGQVNVAWPMGKSMWFAQLPSGGTAFTPERDLALGLGLDGGALAADGRGDIEVFWHGQPPNGKNEDTREVWVSRSVDGGLRFAPAHPVWQQAGVCACCGMAAAAGAGGDFFLIYRAERAQVHRDLYLLHSADRGQTFTGTDFAPWNVGICVMSTAQLTKTSHGLYAAWEQENQVLWAQVAADGTLGPAHAAPGTPGLPGGNRKYPVVAVNRQGQVLMAWTEGMAWKKGGRVAWQLYTADGTPLGAAGSATGVPAWSLVAAFAHPDGSFTVMY
jgi:hypothetical protein